MEKQLLMQMLMQLTIKKSLSYSSMENTEGNLLGAPTSADACCDQQLCELNVIEECLW